MVFSDYVGDRKGYDEDSELDEDSTYQYCSDEDEDSLTESESSGDEEEEASTNVKHDGVLDEEDSCPVCLNEFEEQQIGVPDACNHVFCVDCILQWSKNSNSCPVDRMQMKSVSVYEKFAGYFLRKVAIENIEETPPEEDLTFCEICHSGENEDTLLLCDGCDQGYHCACLSPPLIEVPSGEWFCRICRPSTTAENVENDVGPSSIRRRLSSHGTNRFLGRTSATERVRNLVARSRLQHSTLDDLDLQIDAIVTDILVHAGSRFRVIEEQPTARRQRKTVKRSRRTKSRSRSKKRRPSSKKRKGGKKIKRGTSRRRSKQTCSSTKNTSNSEFVQQPFTMFGGSADLDEYLAGDNEECPSYLIAQKHRQLSRSALRFNAPLPSILTLGQRPVSHIRIPSPPPEPVPDLLGSILSGQEVLMTPSSRISIKRGGLLQVNRNCSSSADTSKREDPAKKTSKIPALKEGAGGIRKTAKSPEKNNSSGKTPSSSRKHNESSSTHRKSNSHSSGSQGGSKSMATSSSRGRDSHKGSEGGMSSIKIENGDPNAGEDNLKNSIKKQNPRKRFNLVKPLPNTDAPKEIQSSGIKSRKIQIKRIFNLPSNPNDPKPKTMEFYDPSEPTEDDDVDLSEIIKREPKEEDFYDPFEPTMSEDEEEHREEAGIEEGDNTVFRKFAPSKVTEDSNEAKEPEIVLDMPDIKKEDNEIQKKNTKDTLITSVEGSGELVTDLDVDEMLDDNLSASFFFSDEKKVKDKEKKISADVDMSSFDMFAEPGDISQEADVQDQSPTHPSSAWREKVRQLSTSHESNEDSVVRLPEFQSGAKSSQPVQFKKLKKNKHQPEDQEKEKKTDNITRSGKKSNEDKTKERAKDEVKKQAESKSIPVNHRKSTETESIKEATKNDSENKREKKRSRSRSKSKKSRRDRSASQSERRDRRKESCSRSRSKKNRHDRSDSRSRSKSVKKEGNSKRGKLSHSRSPCGRRQSRSRSKHGRQSGSKDRQRRTSHRSRSRSHGKGKSGSSKKKSEDRLSRRRSGSRKGSPPNKSESELKQPEVKDKHSLESDSRKKKEKKDDQAKQTVSLESDNREVNQTSDDQDNIGKEKKGKTTKVRRSSKAKKDVTIEPGKEEHDSDIQVLLMEQHEKINKGEEKIAKVTKKSKKKKKETKVEPEELVSDHDMEDEPDNNRLEVDIAEVKSRKKKRREKEHRVMSEDTEDVSEKKSRKLQECVIEEPKPKRAKHREHLKDEKDVEHVEKRKKHKHHVKESDIIEEVNLLQQNEDSENEREIKKKKQKKKSKELEYESSDFGEKVKIQQSKKKKKVKKKRSGSSTPTSFVNDESEKEITSEKKSKKRRRSDFDFNRTNFQESANRSEDPPLVESSPKKTGKKKKKVKEDFVILEEISSDNDILESTKEKKKRGERKHRRPHDGDSEADVDVLGFLEESESKKNRHRKSIPGKSQDVKRKKRHVSPPQQSSTPQYETVSCSSSENIPKGKKKHRNHKKSKKRHSDDEEFIENRHVSLTRILSSQELSVDERACLSPLKTPTLEINNRSGESEADLSSGKPQERDRRYKESYDNAQVNQERFYPAETDISPTLQSHFPEQDIQRIESKSPREMKENHSEITKEQTLQVSKHRHKSTEKRRKSSDERRKSKEGRRKSEEERQNSSKDRRKHGKERHGSSDRGNIPDVAMAKSNSGDELYNPFEPPIINSSDEEHDREGRAKIVEVIEQYNEVTQITEKNLNKNDVVEEEHTNIEMNDSKQTEIGSDPDNFAKDFKQTSPMLGKEKGSAIEEDMFAVSPDISPSEENAQNDKVAFSEEPHHVTKSWDVAGESLVDVVDKIHPEAVEEEAIKKKSDPIEPLIAAVSPDTTEVESKSVDENKEKPDKEIFYHEHTQNVEPTNLLKADVEVVENKQNHRDAPKENKSRDSRFSDVRGRDEKDRSKERRKSSSEDARRQRNRKRSKSPPRRRDSRKYSRRSRSPRKCSRSPRKGSRTSSSRHRRSSRSPHKRSRRSRSRSKHRRNKDHRKHSRSRSPEHAAKHKHSHHRTMSVEDTISEAEDNGPQPIATIGGLSNMDSHRPVTHAMQDHHHGMDEEYDGVIHEMIMSSTQPSALRTLVDVTSNVHSAPTQFSSESVLIQIPTCASTTTVTKPVLKLLSKVSGGVNTEIKPVGKMADPRKTYQQTSMKSNKESLPTTKKKESVIKSPEKESMPDSALVQDSPPPPPPPPLPAQSRAPVAPKKSKLPVIPGLSLVSESDQEKPELYSPTSALTDDEDNADESKVDTETKPSGTESTVAAIPDEIAKLSTDIAAVKQGDNDPSIQDENSLLNPTQILNIIGLNPQQKSAAQNAILSIAELSKHLQLGQLVGNKDSKGKHSHKEEDGLSPVSIDNIETSAVDMYNKGRETAVGDKLLLKKMQFQERVVEEAKLAIKPYYERREISKLEYKEIMKRAVNKICSNESSMEVNNVKIRRLIRRYIEKFQQKNSLKKEKMRTKLDGKNDKSTREHSPSPPPYQPLTPPHPSGKKETEFTKSVTTPSLLKKEPRKIVTLPDLPLPPPPPPPRPRHMM